MTSFAFQLNNGIPILPFYNDNEDEELANVTNHLMALKDSDDVRSGNKEAFGMQQMYKLNVDNFLKYYENNGESLDNSFGSFKRNDENNKNAMRVMVENELDEFKKSLPMYLAKLR